MNYAPLRALAAFLLLSLSPGLKAAPNYVIAVSEATLAVEGWPEVVETLKTKHAERGVEVLNWKDNPEEVLEKLTRMQPRHTCFVARHEEVSTEFVLRVHQLTRNLDEDPYGDTFWGILTGYDVANALRIAKEDKPLTVRKVGSGTELAMDMIEEGTWHCELRKGHKVVKKSGGDAQVLEGPADSTSALVDLLNRYQADLFVTSGHATEHDWQIGFRYRNGSFRCKQGQIYGLDTQRKEHPVSSPNPKVYLPIGNCLMGHIDGPDCMALAWMNSAGVRQMIGYLKPTWFGYMGWGMLDYYVEQPGRYTLNQAFYANNQALLVELAKDPTSRGLKFDRDMVAFYGDPAWEARMAERPKAWVQKLEHDADSGIYTFTLTPKRGAKTFDPINRNGSQRGGRPVIELFEQRLGNFELLEGADWKPVLNDRFLLIPNPGKWDESVKELRIRFKAKSL